MVDMRVLEDGYRNPDNRHSVRVENNRLYFILFFLSFYFLFNLFFIFLFIKPRVRIRVTTVMLSHTSVKSDSLVTVKITSHKTR